MMAMPPGGYHFDSLRPHDMHDYFNHHHLSPIVSQEPAQFCKYLKSVLETSRTKMDARHTHIRETTEEALSLLVGCLKVRQPWRLCQVRRLRPTP